MIITIILLVMTFLGIIFFKLSDKYDKDSFEALGFINLMIGPVCLFISIMVIIISHTLAPKTIQQNKLKYDGLVKRNEIIQSEYEDVSKSDVINDVAEWNMEVYDTKYWTDNPWTNWFNPKEIADNLKYISLE